MAIAGFVGIALLASGLAAVNKEQAGHESSFPKSLHYTGQGMRYWYEKDDGLKSITNIPYDQLACKQCHVKSCDVCHGPKQAKTGAYTSEKAKDTKTCLSCHTKPAWQTSADPNCGDVHAAKGKVCADCHKSGDVHGDGVLRNSMRDDGAVKASCANCHPPKEKESRAHTVHRDKLDCLACHASNSTSCLNCHIDSFIKTGKEEGNYLPPVRDWLLLVNYKGKVTSGSVQTAVYNNKKFIAYGPYFSHSVSAKARQCVDCHGNAATRLLQKDQSVPMAVFKDGKMVPWNGVVPLVPDKLEWSFLNKAQDSWVPVEGNEPAKIQLVNFAEPLTKDQIKKMGMPFKK